MIDAPQLVWDDIVSRPAWEQMAIDRATADLATAAGVAIYRLCRWEADSVSFGANEAASRTWDRERLERLQLPVVRRPTGGRGVWHDATDLTYAVSAPIARFGDLRTAYREIHEQLARALGNLGAAGVLAAAVRRPTLEPGACFDVTMGGEVVVQGRKTIGSAQALIGTALLQHGAIARADRAATLARFRLESVSHSPPATAGELPDRARVATAITARWRDDGGVTIPAGFLDDAVSRSGAFADHFRNTGWTWRR